MPRYASRIDLMIKDIRVERLHDISQKDAIAEGVTKRGNLYCIDWSPVGKPTGIKCHDGSDHMATESYIANDNARGAFATYWEKLNGTTGPKSWDANPWVWVIDFERIRP